MPARRRGSASLPTLLDTLFACGLGSVLESNPDSIWRERGFQLLMEVNRMRSSKLSALVVGVVLALAVSVTVVGSGAAKNTAPAKVKIGYINLSDQLPFVVLVRKSIERAAKANGAKLVVCDSNLDAQKAINCAAQLKLAGREGDPELPARLEGGAARLRRRPEGADVAIDIHQPPCETVFFGATTSRPASSPAPRSASTRRRPGTARPTRSSRSTRRRPARSSSTARTASSPASSRSARA